jgi:DNA (cytosine-5)-methyltransferase 1
MNCCSGIELRPRHKKPSPYSALLRCEFDDPTDYSYPRDFDSSLLTSSLRTIHTDLSKKRFADTQPGDTEPVSRFYKLDPSGVSNTIRAGTASDHGAFTSPRPIHPISPRSITVREAARLHSYPDWFRFHVTKWHGFRQIGNSVPPLLARAVASKICEAITTAQKPDRQITQGDPRLLSFGMSAAASYFGVPADTIPKRTRGMPRSEVHG